MVPVFVLWLTVLLGFAIAALVLGRKSFERRELQSAADAFALAAAYAVEQRGLQGLSLAVGDRNWALALAARNSRMNLTPASAEVVIERHPTEHRVVVKVRLATKFDSGQKWFPNPMIEVWATSQAQVNEQEYGELWPAIDFLLDGSESMGWPIPGSNETKPASQVLVELIKEYASYTLPVRNGVVVFENDIAPGSVAPPQQKVVDHGKAISDGVAKLNPATGKMSNAFAALQRAGADLANSGPGGRNVVFISDGESTAGGLGCANRTQCNIDQARQESDKLRALVPDGVALFSVEIRRKNFTPEAEQFLRAIAGPPAAAGLAAPDVDKAAFYHLAQSILGIQTFLNDLTRSICTFGPLDPAPGAPADAVRMRRGVLGLMGPPRRVHAHLRNVNGQETVIPSVPARDLVPEQPGFEYLLQEKNGQRRAYVILTRTSCNQLGSHVANRLVVRWDEAQLSPLPK